MQQPEGFGKFDKQGSSLICKLKKSLFGLKQSDRNWYLTIKNFLSQLNFTPAIQDECFFIKKSENAIEGIVCLWVDDMVILVICDYRGIVGCLNCLALTSGTDIAHADILLSFLVQNPGKRHWNAAKGCLRYL